MINTTETGISEDRESSAQGLFAALIQEELSTILLSTPFRRSKQSREFLQYIVDRTLSGNGESLKERVIGVEVFRRQADYDTSADPIVRSRAIEVRKRLAQYYLGEGEHAPIRIEISPGAYHASFVTPSESVDLPSIRSVEISSPQIPEEIALTTSAPSVGASKPTRTLRFSFGGVSILLVVTALLAIAIPSALMRRGTAMDQFWSPLFNGAKPLLIYTGSLQWGNSFITAGDLSASVKVGALLSHDQESFDIRSGDDISFEDLRQFPTVLIGCLNNRWTMFVNDDLQLGCLIDKVPMIEERTGAMRQWTSIRSSDGTLQADYALVTRLVSSKMGQPLIAIAGITDSGTRAAAEFITNKQQMAELVMSAPKGWEKKNMQFVLQTKVVNKIPSTTSVVAVRYW